MDVDICLHLQAFFTSILFLAPLVPPENFTYTNKTARSISLRWEPPKEPYSELQEYELTKEDQREPKDAESVSTTNTTHTFIKLHPNRYYVFKVQYIGKDYLRSPVSNPLTVKTEISSKKICSLFFDRSIPLFHREQLSRSSYSFPGCYTLIFL